MTGYAYFSSAFCFFLEFADIPLDPLFGFKIVGKFLFVAFEGRGVVVAAAVYMFGGVVDVEHFVEDDVFDHVFWDGEGIERAADGNVVVRRVVMAEYAKCFSG